MYFLEKFFWRVRNISHLFSSTRFLRVRNIFTYFLQPFSNAVRIYLFYSFIFFKIFFDASKILFSFIFFNLFLTRPKFSSLIFFENFFWRVRIFLIYLFFFKFIFLFMSRQKFFQSFAGILCNACDVKSIWVVFSLMPKIKIDNFHN